MTLSTALQELASAVDILESAGVTVHEVTTDEDQRSLLNDDQLRVRLTVNIPLESTTQAEEGSTRQEDVGEDGETLATDGTEAGEPFAMDVDPPDATTVVACATEPMSVPPMPDTPAQNRTGDGVSDQPEIPDSSDATEEEADAAMEVDDADTTSAEVSDVDEESTTDSASVPAHRDPERLQAVYDQYSTFAEMTDALDMDVTSQTVRYHMIKQGIHDPESQQTTDSDSDEEVTTPQEDTDSPRKQSDVPHDADGHDEDNVEKAKEGSEKSDESTGETAEQTDETSEESSDGTDNDGQSVREGETGTEAGDHTDSPDQKSADTVDTDVPTMANMDDLPIPAGVELPSHLSIEDVRDAILEAQTLFEVQQQLRIGRDKARKLLSDLNLLDLDVGRATTIENRDASQQEIYRRLSQAVDS